MEQTCDVIFNLPPRHISYIIANHHLKPFLVIELFIKKFPNSPLINHCLRKNTECFICEKKLKELLKNGSHYGIADM